MSNNQQSEHEVSRKMAYFILVNTLNASGRLDQAQALKGAQYQLESMEEHGNNCWPAERRTNDQHNHRSKPNGHGKKRQRESVDRY